MGILAENSPGVVKEGMYKLILFLVLAFSASSHASVSCNYNQGGVRFYMVITNAAAATGGLHAKLGQPGFSMNTDFAFRASDLSEHTKSGAQPSFKVNSTRGQSSVSVVVNAGKVSIRYKGTDGEWSMDDAPITCQ